jgi:site-specific DNA-methyltransferase (adenine-specific)
MMPKMTVTAATARAGESFKLGQSSISFSPAEELYDKWPSPTCIIVDGPYGVAGFPGDLPTHDQLASWYRPHIEQWTRFSTPQTTLWFWGTEIGWANVHPVLAENDWEYRCCHIWDKGMSHVAGNSNTQTLRKFPVVTEVCVQYAKAARFLVAGKKVSSQEWLRYEWKRTGLPFRLANEACEVLNAATRKYLTGDHLWYYPPPEAFEKLARYANQHGKPSGLPYFSVDGRHSMSSVDWARLRAKFKCEFGVTNVWHGSQVSGAERIQGARNGMRYKFASLHGSQKPRKFIERIVRACTDEGDVVWEPFGGLCPGAIVCHDLKREYYAAEIVPEFYSAAIERLAVHAKKTQPTLTAIAS